MPSDIEVFFAQKNLSYNNVIRNKVARSQPQTPMNKYKLDCFKFEDNFFDPSRMVQL